MNWDTKILKNTADSASLLDRFHQDNGHADDAWTTADHGDVEQALGDVERPFALRQEQGQWQLRLLRADEGLPASTAFVPACRLEDLGDHGFCADHGLRYAYVAGAMANGIGSVEIVQAMSRAGMLAFFGAAGLPLQRIEQAIDRLQSALGPLPYGFNLIHSPNEPNLESGAVDLYLKKRVHLVEASAYLDLNLPVVRYRVSGIHRGRDGIAATPNRIIAKVSRIEVARKFMAPPPDGLLQQLIEGGDITAEQAKLAKTIPMAQDITAEADSAGHTDNRPAFTLLPTLTALRNQMQQDYDYALPLRVGAAGGISTPASASAAFAMGAAYVLTGSVNQACVESGSSDIVRQMLAEAEQADIMMAPAADMFEMGVRLQVLKRGTMFAMRAAKLYEIYRARNSLDDIPATERQQLEKTIFRMPLEEVWHSTRDFFRERDPAQIERAENNPRHKMALVFRWYLGLSSQWANHGEPDRKIDYQVWCGPAMGAFNEWVQGSFLEPAKNRRVVPVALNILYGTAVLFRSQMLRLQGVALPGNVPQLKPLSPDELQQRIKGGPIQ